MADQAVTSSPQLVSADSPAAAAAAAAAAVAISEHIAAQDYPIPNPISSPPSRSPSFDIQTSLWCLTDRMPPVDPKTGPPVSWIPREIVQQILIAADPNTFASLSLLNRCWYGVAQQASIYGLQLSRCLSFVASNKSFSTSSFKDDDLPRLRRLFALEVKRNLYDAYLRPAATEIRLISTTIGSTSAPGGEGLQFNPSPQGHHLLAFNSSRIYVVDLRQHDPQIVRELSTLRRPVSTCIKDDGTLLAVLSTESQVDVYDLSKSPPKRSQSLILDNTPRTIALSPCGTVLAAAYPGGIEVSSLRSDALATDRRAVKTDTVDSLCFSFNGTQLLGTTLNSTSPSTVIITAPYYDPGAATENNSSLWTTSILFPNTSRDCSHAVLIQHTSHEEASWTFTYDRNFETFRAVRIDDLRNGTTYWTGPLPSHAPSANTKLMPCTLPAATYHGDLVSAGFLGKDVWLYGVPQDLDAIPKFKAENINDHDGAGLGVNLGRKTSSVSNRSSPGPAARVPQWQKLFAKNPNTFVQGYKVAELKGVANVKFVEGYGGNDRVKERLVIAARGVTVDIDEDDMNFIDGGRITILDFGYSLHNGSSRSLEIEVGTKQAEVLEEVRRDLDDEVAIVRRRTVARKTGGARSSLLRAATEANASGSPISAIPPLPLPENDAETRTADDDDDDPLVPRRLHVLPSTNGAIISRSIVESPTSEEASPWETFDAPYSQQNPRSTNTLRRAATAAAANRRLRPIAPNVEYRRADGRREHPHESDADNWVPPPPPYQAEDPGAVPNFMRQPAVAPLVDAQRPQTSLGAAVSPWGLSMMQEGSLTPSTLASSSPPRTSESLVSPISLTSPQRAMTVVATMRSDPRLAIAQRRSHHSSHSRTLSDMLPTVVTVSTPVPGGPASAIESTSRGLNLDNNVAAITTQTIQGSLFSETRDDLYDASPPNTAAEPRAPPLPSNPPPVSTAPRIPTPLTLRSVSMPQRPSTMSAALGSPVAHSSTFSPGGGDDYDPPAVWRLSPGNDHELTPPTRRPLLAQTWPAGLNDAEATASPQSVRSTERPMTLLNRAVPLNLNIDTSQFIFPKVARGIHSYSAVEPPSSHSTLLPPPSLHAHSHSITGTSFSESSTPVHFGTDTPPLMISTPTGVISSSGSPFRIDMSRRPEMPIFAPVARRPPMMGGHINRPTVENLEHLLDPCIGCNPQASSASVPIFPLFPPLPSEAAHNSSQRHLPAWLNVTSSRHSHSRPASIRRSRSHTSRATRSAAKNVRDAQKKKGWSTSTTGARKKRRGKDVDGMSVSAWTDISRGGTPWGTMDGRNKCSVM